MKEYSCENCGNIFSQKSHYNNHMNRMRPCKKIDNKIIEEKIIEKINELSNNGDIEIKNINLINNIENKQLNMVKTGIKRDTIDQFYTNKDISINCIELLLNTLKINKDNIILEPSAGNGSFSDYFFRNGYNIFAYDIDPKKDYIVKQNFLELDLGDFNKKIHCIGNPPFGRQSTLAKQFIKKCSLYCDSISFILPKSFRTPSYQRCFPSCFHLIKEIDIEKNAFTIDNKIHNVPCVFQIWEKKSNDRFIEPKLTEIGYHFVKKPEVECIEFNEDNKPIKKNNIFIEEPDFGILRAGGGKKCGRISTDIYNGIGCYPEAWLFIKLDDNINKDRFLEAYIKIDWSSDTNVGARSISKQIFIKGINGIINQCN